jgi:DNA (cytosine-5)-methyltransferase 1
MKVVSLFSGAGGLDLGLINEGHKIIWANDIDPDAVKTYEHNIGKHIYLADIGQLPDDELPQADVVVGGFPCQGFSLANRKRSGDDSRNKLYLQFLRVIETTKPYYFIAENVRGILSLDNGDAIKKIVSDFMDAGYRVKYSLFNAADFGVPQSRMRVIIAGTRNDLPLECDFNFPEKTHSKKPCNNQIKWISIADGISGIPDPEKFPDALPNQLFSKYKVTNRNFTGHRRTDPDKPSPTILARGNGGGGVCAIQHPENHRRMSVRESAAVQTFPIDFEFFGSMNSQYRQVGNAVPVKFGAALGRALKASEKKLKTFLKAKK